MTLLYGGLFLVCGAALLAVTYTLVSHAAPVNGPLVFARAVRAPPNGALNFTFHGNQTQGYIGTAASGPIPVPFRKLLTSHAGQRAVQATVAGQRGADLNQLEVESAVALAIMALISALLGWVVAGRVLRPLRTITTTTQEISEANLHRRLALPGPRDELRQLSDTIDGLLARLEGAFGAQRRFVANASHELRTPLTAARALLELVLSDPRATAATFREACEQVLKENEYQEQLIDALLTLAQGQRGLDRHELVDLAEVTQRVVPTHELAAAASGVRLEVSVAPAFLIGDPRLVERLVANLVENAIGHNRPDGHAEVVVETKNREATLKVTNTGPAILAAEVDRLLQPFQRLSRERVGHGDGLGLGLSIVAAIATAHDAKLDVSPRETGGLKVEVRFPQDPRNGSGAGQLVLENLAEGVARKGLDELHPAGTLERG